MREVLTPVFQPVFRGVFGEPTPAFDYSATSLAVPTGFTFARASTATFVGSNGLIQSSSTGTPRFDYDPKTLNLRGLLIEETATNGCRMSENSDSTPWVKFLTTAAIDAAFVNPTGGTGANLLQATASSGFHGVVATSSAATTLGGYVTFSCFYKQSATEYVIQHEISNGGTNGARVNVDLRDGSTGAPTAIGLGSGIRTKVEQFPNGWYRVTISCIMDSTSSVFRGGAFLCNNNINAATYASYLGVASGGVYMWGGQLEIYGYSTSYIPNTSTTAGVVRASEGLSAAPVARASTATYVNSSGLLATAAIDEGRYQNYNPTNLTGPSLLIEATKTNLARINRGFDDAYWSKINSTVTANTTETTDPFGVNLADKFIFSATSGPHGVSRSGLGSSTVQNTASIFVKKLNFRYFLVTLQGSVSAGSARAVFDLDTGTINISGTFGSNATFQSASITAFPNGWYRVSVTGIADTAAGTCMVIFVAGQNNNLGSALFSGDGTQGFYLYGAQLETGGLTSYIPNDSSAADVVRAADVVNLPWFSPTQNTYFTQWTGQYARSSSTRWIEVNNGVSDAERIILLQRSDFRPNYQIATGGTTIRSMSIGDISSTPPETISAAIRYQSQNYALRAVSSNSAVAVGDGALPAAANLTQFYLGRTRANNTQPNSHLRILRVWSQAFTNSQLQGIA